MGESANEYAQKQGAGLYNFFTMSQAARFSITGLTGYTNRILGRLALLPNAAELDELQGSLLASSRRLEISLTRQRLQSDHLTPAARALRGWLAFFSDRQNLGDYVDAAKIGTTILESLLDGQSRWKPPALIYLRPMRGIYKARQEVDGLRISLPTAAIGFKEEEWQHVGKLLIQGDRAAKRHLLTTMQSEGYLAIAGELDALGGGSHDTVGCTYDLAEIFARVNSRYFGGNMRRPTLCWSRSRTFRKFGHYDWIGDTVMLSRTLDSPQVEAFVLDFVMYHELLHITHGIRWTAGSSRGYAHTAAFYRDERQFDQYEQAELELSKLARHRR